MEKIRRALISVSDKNGIVDLAKFLDSQGVQILSTGGTLKALTDAGVPAVQVSDFTGSPEILDGRVKTLHPKIHGGILGRRDLDSHKMQMREHGIEPIDLVVVNLYPFEKVTANPDCSLEDAIENIDIGGPSMVRSAAKNSDSVAVVTDPADYARVQSEMEANGGAIGAETRRYLMVKAFARTAEYDSAIAGYLSSKSEKTAAIPDRIQLNLKKVGDLRYGENPHQKAAWYTDGSSGPKLPNAKVLSGKELSYNNLLDLESAARMVRDFAEPTVAILKHNNPCGLASDSDLATAYKNAYDCDPVSAYGSIIGLNRIVDAATAERIHESPFVEAVIAPGYAEGVLDLLTEKQSRRFLELPGLDQNPEKGTLELRFIEGGALAQEKDVAWEDDYDWKVVTKRQPTAEEKASLLFAFRAVKHVKSNAIVLVQGTHTVGIGAGQMNRLESVRIATKNAGDKAKGSVLGSDAFFPFRDGVDAAAEAGVGLIIQPGGSKRDDEAIEAADEAGIAMVFTGVRHFRH
ncbi:MAG: bifunctional phosphoribosylaminoimidazolecarboxamide formyltransferase/IMP cyclohydrolase [Candidatus Omnitrophica bacterium]|nr:bifunctional phosphoribosylaminoimidazolecarboxamide formyltransferase/IMP cyclohydrolase [Candidatus Omnitrophota bacterium]